MWEHIFVLKLFVKFLASIITLYLTTNFFQNETYYIVIYCYSFANCNKKLQPKRKKSQKRSRKKQPVTIHKYKNDSIVYDKTELDSFKIKFPEMASVTYPLQPDVAYAILSENGEFNSKFSSETDKMSFVYFILIFKGEER